MTEKNAVQKFVEKYGDQMTGVLSGFDRVLFKGYLPLGWPEAMESLLGRQERLIKDIKAFVTGQSARFKAWADDLAEKHGRSHLFLRKRMKKEQIRAALYGPLPRDAITARRQRARVTRLLQRLHAHGLIAKIPRTRRWRPSTLARTIHEEPRKTRNHTEVEELQQVDVLRCVC